MVQMQILLSLYVIIYEWQSKYTTESHIHTLGVYMNLLIGYRVDANLIGHCGKHHTDQPNMKSASPRISTSTHA